jgi:hypothetical protein
MVNPMTDLMPDERELLLWLGEYTHCECYGSSLDSLMAKGLVELCGAEYPWNPNGKGRPYRAVHLTDAGRAALPEQRAIEEVWKGREEG